MSNIEINNVSRRPEKVKFKLVVVLAEIDGLENTVKEIKSKSTNTDEIERLPRTNFTTISKSEANEKKQDDKMNTSRIIFDKEKNEDNEVILVASDGSYVKKI